MGQTQTDFCRPGSPNGGSQIGRRSTRCALGRRPPAIPDSQVEGIERFLGFKTYAKGGRTVGASSRWRRKPASVHHPDAGKQKKFTALR